MEEMNEGKSAWVMVLRKVSGSVRGKENGSRAAEKNPAVRSGERRIACCSDGSRHWWLAAGGIGHYWYYDKEKLHFLGGGRTYLSRDGKIYARH